MTTRHAEKWLIASAARYVSVTLPISPESHVLLTLEPSGSAVSGQVVDAIGGPLRGASLTARSALGVIVSTATSGEEGSFRLSAPMDEALQVSAHAEGYSRVTQRAQAPTEGLTLRLAPAASIVGRVTADATGEAIPQVSVTITAAGVGDGSTSELTDLNGSFRFNELPAGRYMLSAHALNWRSTDIWVSVGVGEVFEPVELTVSRATTLAGAVEVGESACQDGYVALTGPQSLLAHPGPTGAYSFDGVTPGLYQAKVWCRGARPQRDAIKVGEEPIEHSWRLDAGLSVRGSVVTANGRPVQGVRVAVEPATPPPMIAVGERHASSLSNFLSPFASGTECITDDLGEFECGGLDRGEYLCRIADTPQRQAETKVISLDLGLPSHVVLRMQSGGTISATIRNLGSRATFEIFVSTMTGGVFQGHQRGGAVLFENLPLGSYQVTVGLTPRAPISLILL